MTKTENKNVIPCLVSVDIYSTLQAAREAETKEQAVYSICFDGENHWLERGRSVFQTTGFILRPASDPKRIDLDPEAEACEFCGDPLLPENEFICPCSTNADVIR